MKIQESETAKKQKQSQPILYRKQKIEQKKKKRLETNHMYDEKNTRERESPEAFAVKHTYRHSDAGGGGYSDADDLVLWCSFVVHVVFSMCPTAAAWVIRIPSSCRRSFC